jgi:hypothetical protein
MHSTKDRGIVDGGEADAVVDEGEVVDEVVVVDVVEGAAEEEENPTVATATRRPRIPLQARKVPARRGSGLLSPMVDQTSVSGGMLLLQLSNLRRR